VRRFKLHTLFVQAAELAEQTAQRMAEADKDEAICARRAALLREAAYLKDYLPKGVLKDSAEYEMLQQAYAKKVALATAPEAQ
jgi:hypothetical protein